jgi:hypothetical protein
VSLERTGRGSKWPYHQRCPNRDLQRRRSTRQRAPSTVQLRLAPGEHGRERCRHEQAAYLTWAVPYVDHPRLEGLTAASLGLGLSERRQRHETPNLPRFCLGEGAELPRRALWLGRVRPLDLGVRIVGTQPEYKWAAVDSNHLPPR